MAFDRQAALDAGYTEQEIDSYLQNQAGSEPPPPPQATATGEPPAPTTQVTPVEPSLTSGLATAAIGAAPYVLPVAGAAGAAFGGSKLYGAWNASAEAAKALADAKMASEQGIAQRAAQRMGGGAPSPASAARPMPGYGPTTYNAPVANAPAVPATPAAQPAAAPQQPGAVRRGLQQGMEYANKVRQIAMEKVMQNAGTIGKAGIGAGAMLYSPGLNQGEDEELRRRRMMPPTIR